MQATLYRSPQSRRQGIGLVYGIILIVALCAIASLAVDYGRVQVVKTQLRAAADAAALAAGQFVFSDAAEAKRVAKDVAAANNADGTPVVLEPGEDIEMGIWDDTARTFTPTNGRTTPNAVRVTARRVAERGTAVDLPFAKVIGANTCNVQSVAIAMAKPTRFAMVGLDFITMDGNSTNSYRKKGDAFTNYGNIASNGDITLSGSTLVNGNAYPGVGRTVYGANHVSGTTSPLLSPLVYPQADPGNTATDNDNKNIPSWAMDKGVLRLGNQKSLTLPGGTYYLKGIDLQAGSQLAFSGPATVYVTGSVTYSGHASTYIDNPDDLKLIVLGTGGRIDLNGGSDLHADIYAPGATLTLSGTSDLYGCIVAKSISTIGTAAVHYNLNMSGGVSLVK